MLHKHCIAALLVAFSALPALASDQGVTVVTIDNPNKQLTVTVPIVEGVDPTQIAEHAPGVNEHLDPELEANIHSIIHENQHDKNQDDKEFDEDDIDEFDELDEELNQENQPNQHNRVTKDKAGVKHSNFDEVEEADDVSEEDTSKPAEKDAESGPESKEQETIDEKELDETENAKKEGIIQAAANSSPQVTGCKTQGQLAITYNEGPSDITAQVLRQYAKADARATFFVNASWLYTQQYAMVVKNIYNAGHFIGMTYRVKDTNPANYKEDEVRKDIIKMAATIESIIKISPKYVRLYATKEKDYKTEKLLRELGFVIVGYNLDSQDYSKQEATGPNSIQEVYSKAFKNYKEQFDTKGAFISLNYDLPFTGSLVAVPNVINTVNKEGYTMVRLDGCLDDTKPYKKTANSTEYVSDKFSFGQPDYHSGQKRELLDSVVILDKPGSGGVGGSNGEKSENMGNAQKASITLCLPAIIFSLFF